MGGLPSSGCVTAIEHEFTIPRAGVIGDVGWSCWPPPSRSFQPPASWEADSGAAPACRATIRTEESSSYSRPPVWRRGGEAPFPLPLPSKTRLPSLLSRYEHSDFSPLCGVPAPTELRSRKETPRAASIRGGSPIRPTYKRHFPPRQNRLADVLEPLPPCPATPIGLALVASMGPDFVSTCTNAVRSSRTKQ